MLKEKHGSYAASIPIINLILVLAYKLSVIYWSDQIEGYDLHAVKTRRIHSSYRTKIPVKLAL